MNRNLYSDGKDHASFTCSYIKTALLKVGNNFSIKDFIGRS